MDNEATQVDLTLKERLKIANNYRLNTLWIMLVVSWIAVALLSLLVYLFSTIVSNLESADGLGMLIIVVSLVFIVTPIFVVVKMARANRNRFYEWYGEANKFYLTTDYTLSKRVIGRRLRYFADITLNDQLHTLDISDAHYRYLEDDSTRNLLYARSLGGMVRSMGYAYGRLGDGPNPLAVVGFVLGLIFTVALLFTAIIMQLPRLQELVNLLLF